jgi:hypothetical protein
MNVSLFLLTEVQLLNALINPPHHHPQYKKTKLDFFNVAVSSTSEMSFLSLSLLHAVQQIIG